MKLRQRVYAMVMVVIYVAATLLSSLSLITCDKHHHHHGDVEHHHTSCSCKGLTFVADCCDHEHPILGENHTEYITSELRNDSRAVYALVVLLSPAVVPSVAGELSCSSMSTCEIDFGGEHMPLCAAFIPCETLRAPPVLV